MKTKINIMMIAIIAALLFSCTKENALNEPGSLVPLTVDQDPSIPSITVNGAMFHSEAFGDPDSTMVVCIHGGPGSDSREMLNYKDLVSYGYRVIFFDQRGSGLSQRFPGDFYVSRGKGALDVLCDDLTGVIAYYRTHPSQKVYLAGHSWGAMYATMYTGRYPQSVNGLVLSEPGGLKWEDVMEFVSKSRSFSLWGEILNNATYLDQFLTGKEDQHEILDYKAAMTGSKNDITGDDGSKPGSFWRMGAIISTSLFEVGERYEPDFSTGIGDFNIPILFFYSEKDKAYPDSWAQKITAAYNTVEVHKVPGVGHTGIISDSRAWNETTLPFILNYFKSL